MKTIQINGTPREGFGKRDAKNVRKMNHVPCVLYGGQDNIHFTAHANELGKIIYTPNVYQVSLNIDGKSVPCILKDIQFHPVTDAILHIDFIQVIDGKPLDIKLPVKLNGLAAGVKAGGKLSLNMKRIKVRGMIDKLPDFLDVDVTSLKLGKSIKIQSLNFDGLEVLEPKNAVVAMVKLTRASRGMAANAEDSDEEAGDSNE